MSRKGIEVEMNGNVVIAHWTEHATVAEASSYLERIDRLLTGGRPFSIVLDARGMQRSPEARVRKLVAERLAAQKTARKLLLRGEATVLESALVRGGLTAIYWLSPPGYPWKIFGDMSEALHWAQAQLAASRASLHP